MDGQSTATVLAASISAGALVAVFAAKSLAIAVVGAAGFITLGETLDLFESIKVSQLQKFSLKLDPLSPEAVFKQNF